MGIEDKMLKEFDKQTIFDIMYYHAKSKGTKI